ncbi:hypothetical protein [Natronoglycomyces albus]|uniref:Uncharacterized protein n=1 Tax=Natronoglycomyces albus TaxID=2811108 RepID=A0A895XP14_9ACTN|nr:hypothetical protein [Natronoglycomyces albus]QSB05283.1 hypothetical protein JQS30_16270 [Natronoglycomyces albus]
MRSKLIPMIAAASLLGACASDTDESSPDLDSDVVEQYMAQYIDNNIAYEELRAAKERLEQMCMEDLGYDIGAYNFYGGLSEETTDRDVMRYVWTKPIFGEDYPMVQRRWEDGDSHNPWDLLSDEERDEIWEAAYGGSGHTEEVEFPAGGGVAQWSSGGCAGQVNDIVHEGEIRDYMVLYAQAVGGHFGTWDTQDDVVAARADWSNCMEEHGYPELEQPRDAASLVMSEAMMLGGGDVPQEAIEEFERYQRDMKTADIECHDRYDLEEVQTEAYWQERTAMLLDYEVAVFAFADEAQEALERAQDILASGELPAS